MNRPAISEAKLLFLLGAIQFVNVLDFMMVMPLGPDFATALGIAPSKIGLIGGSYTASAAVAGILGSLFLDRFDRKPALALSLFGLVLATAAGGFAQGLPSLVLARVMAGVFGGPATSLSMAIIADVIPAARRGRAMGAVMGAFSVASVLGVPAGLKLAELGGFRLPFFAVAGLGAVVALLALIQMPSFTGHLTAKKPEPGASSELFKRPAVWLSLAGTAVTMMGNFAIIPNLTVYWVFNRGYPRPDLPILYLVGGLCTFVTMRLSGQLVDRYGPSRVATGGTVLFIVTLFVGFITPIDTIPILLVSVLFMTTGTFRIIPMQSIATRLPAPQDRARFMSTQSAVQHLASALGAFLSSLMLSEGPRSTLIGMENVALLTAGLALTFPFLLYFVESDVTRREAAARDSIPPGVRSSRP